MTRSDFGRDVLIKILVGFVVVAATALLLALLKVFREGIASYDPVVVTVVAVFFGAVFVYEILARRSRQQLYGIVTVYVCAVASFFIVTSWGTEAVRKAHVAVGLAFGTLLVGRGVLHIQNYDEGARERAERRGMGYAATGVLISEAIPADPSFILVRNLNLRSKEGLWVPPGGHFTPFRENPEEVLVAKLVAEVGMACALSAVHAGSLPRVEERRTNASQWLVPPAFLLREEMFGLCSHLHSSHLDFVYVCVTNGTKVGSSPKYAESQRIQVPIHRCVTGIEESERAIGDAIDAWFRNQGEKPPGRREDVTKDVAWRLHLAARMYVKG